ncbi:hypothetical protein FD718_04680, partial [Photobacterium damselae subsp. damselae]
MFLVGCSSKYDPASEPSTITLSMVATDTINPNNNGDALRNPLMILIKII